MRAEDLRIGNLVYIPQLKKHSQIGVIEENGRFTTKNYSSSFSSIECLQPIPLTEEWLLKFGFNCVSDHNPNKKVFRLNFGYFKELNFAVNSEYGELNYFRYNGGYTNIKHVHQLQNLYFALTCEELTLK
jgi:hypothetical protein